MKIENFCYWLQGYFELTGDDVKQGLTPKQVEVIRRHLNMVFAHEIDPGLGPPAHQEKLDKIHLGEDCLGDLRGIPEDELGMDHTNYSVSLVRPLIKC